MTGLTSKDLSTTADILAPDGSEVRVLVSASRGSMAHFRLLPGQVSMAVAHRTVEEVWYVKVGQGRMWRKLAESEGVIDLVPGLSLTIPVGAHFQFRNDGVTPLDIVGVTMPPWPGADEAYEVSGKW